MHLLLMCGRFIHRRILADQSIFDMIIKNPWTITIGLVVAIALMAGSYYQGWSMRGDREAAKQLELERQAAIALEKERERGNQLSLELEEEKRNIKTVTVEVIKEVPKVTKVYVEVPGEAEKPIPPAIITWGAVGVFDRALRPDLPATASVFAHPPGGTDLARAPVDIQDILETHTINASKYAECRAQLNALIDWFEGQKKGPQ